MIETAIVATVFIVMFLVGVFVGGIGALRCVKFGIRAAYEVKNGNQGFTDEDNAQDEIDMLNKKEKNERG